MKQPIKGVGKVKKRKKSSTNVGKKKFNEKYGTSKLELYFAHTFLDKMGLMYIYQYEAKDIGRYFDFVVTAYDDYNYIMEDKDGLTCVKQDGQLFMPCLVIEVDGDYWHTNPNKFDVNKMNPTQKHNRFVDRLKDEWAGKHCIPIVRFWEDDIHKNPKYIFDTLKKYMGDGKKKRLINENRKKPH